MPSSLPLGVPEKRLLIELCFLDHSKEVVAEEHALDLTLIVVVDGMRSSVTIAAIEGWLSSCFKVPTDNV
jgi:hypothetical protein